MFLPQTKRKIELLNMKTTWKQIKDFPAYDVSNKGKVRSRQRGYFYPLKCHFRGSYLDVTLCNKKRCYQKYIHILVLEAFISPRPKNYVGNHKNGVKTNNELKNLEWVTRSEDAKHAYTLGLNTRVIFGENAPGAKLKNGEVWLIKRLLWFEWPHRKIAKMFKVSRGLITDINLKRSWQHIKFKPSEKDRRLYRTK